MRLNLILKTRSTLKRVTLIIILTISVIRLSGQTLDRKFSMGVFIGKTEYLGDLGNGFLDFAPHYASIEFAAGWYLNRSVDLAIQGEYGDYGYFRDYFTNFLARKTQATLLLKYKLNNGYILKENARIAPYLAIGGGIAGFVPGRELEESPGDRTYSGIDGIFPFGAGVKFRIIPAIYLEYQFLNNLTSGDLRDMAVAGGNDRFFTHSLGIGLNFGYDTDPDRDGVTKRKDKCPNTPEGVSVDADGCPADLDGDGIPDYLDECPQSAGEPALEGCPD
jgi:hypothetical protein